MAPWSYRLVLATGFCVAAAGCATGSALTDGSTQPRKSYILPVVEIVGFQAGLNLVDRQLVDDGTFDVTMASIRRNLRGPWVVDQDAFEVNQFLHPYQGSIYHTSARASGLTYWQSVAYTFAGSALWEIAGETTPPSKNDQIASGIAGSFFGEAMFRTANLLVDKAENRPGAGRMLMVALLSPPTALNRVAFGDRFDYVMPTHDPLYDARVQVGVAGARQAGDARFRLRRDETVLDLSLEYGLPGRTDYRYSRPFDYYSLQATASTESGLESVTSRGLLVGRGYEAGLSGRGVWGLYGVYEYLSPHLFRVSSTALALGTSSHWAFGRTAVHTTGLAGLGFAAAQTLANDDDHHYGLTPQAAASLRLTAGSRAAFDISGRGFLVSDIGGYETPTDDLVLRAEASLGLRLFSRHAVSLRYVFNRRDASVTLLAREAVGRQQRETFGIFYTLLGPQGFGATRWNR